MADDVAIASAGDLDAYLASLARGMRMVFFAGLPGVGKSLLIRELALAAHRAGRIVHLLQWDVVRPAFVTPALEAKYPERGGQTHATMRAAIGRWSRGAVLDWHRRHGDAHLLVGEVPLVGGRLLDLVEVLPDDAEPVLAGPGALFVTPVPSIAVRDAIERARGRTFADPAHPREREDAPIEILEKIWREVHALAARLGAAEASSDARVPFDPRAYAAVYRHLLRHRPSTVLRIDARIEPRGSVYELGIPTHELAPGAGEAERMVARLERERSAEDLEEYAARWFDRV